MVQGFNLLYPLLKGAGLFCTETVAHGSRHQLRLDGYPEGTCWDPLVGPWGTPPTNGWEFFRKGEISLNRSKQNGDF